MPNTDLTHVTSAAAVSRSITSQPKTPVVVHWQLQDFPIRIARRLVEQQHGILWVVATEARRRIAVAALQAAGIHVNSSTEPVVAPQEPLTAMQKVRREFKKKAPVPNPFPPPGAGTVTVVPIQSFWHHSHLDQFLGGVSPLVVFDHVGSLNVQPSKADLSEEGEGVVTVTAARVVNVHPISVLRCRIPMVFLCRDELEIALLGADFARNDIPVANISTQWRTNPSLTISVVGTDLVTSAYAVGAFLSILACHSDVQVVGEALIGALTPDKLSMSTCTPLVKGVLKLSQQQRALAEIAAGQADVKPEALRTMRVRDHIRTATLAFDPACRKPELVIFCPWNMVELVRSVVTAHYTSRLPKLALRARWRDRPDMNQLGNRVAAAAWGFPSKLNHGSRLCRISGALGATDQEKLPKRIMRLAIALHRATGVRHTDLDLADRPEAFAGRSDKGDIVLAVFNKVLELAYPWSPKAPKDGAEHRASRLEVFRRYKKHWADPSAAISVATSINPAEALTAPGSHHVN